MKESKSFDCHMNVNLMESYLHQLELEEEVLNNHVNKTSKVKRKV
jgi:hypothetical protein